MSGDQRASVQSVAKVLPLLAFIRRGNALFVHFKRIAGVSNWPLTVCFHLGKVWPVGGSFLVSSQRGKGPFGVGGNGLTTTRGVPISFICVDLSRLAVGQWQRFCRS